MQELLSGERKAQNLYRWYPRVCPDCESELSKDGRLREPMMSLFEQRTVQCLHIEVRTNETSLAVCKETLTLKRGRAERPVEGRTS
jgi:hypothetical protein